MRKIISLFIAVSVLNIACLFGVADGEKMCRTGLPTGGYYLLESLQETVQFSYSETTAITRILHDIDKGIAVVIPQDSWLLVEERNGDFALVRYGKKRLWVVTHVLICPKEHE